MIIILLSWLNEVFYGTVLCELDGVIPTLCGH